MELPAIQLRTMPSLHHTKKTANIKLRVPAFQKMVSHADLIISTFHLILSCNRKLTRVLFALNTFHEKWNYIKSWLPLPDSA